MCVAVMCGLPYKGLCDGDQALIPHHAAFHVQTARARMEQPAGDDCIIVPGPGWSSQQGMTASWCLAMSSVVLLST